MSPRLVLACTAFAALPACATSQTSGDVAGDVATGNRMCAADPGQRFVGQKASQAVGDAIVAATGAEIFQWVPPDSAVTMDYRQNRVRVGYDRDMVIQSVRCG